MLSTVLLIHLDRVVRERIETALRGRGLTVLSSVDVEGALDSAEAQSATAVLVDPRILIKEEFDIHTRFTLRLGHPVRLIALTHIAGAADAQAFQRHGASLLIAPLENLDLLALYLGAGQAMPDVLPVGVAPDAIPVAFDPGEVTNIAPAPARSRAEEDPSIPEEDRMTPEMEKALERARAEVRRIRAEHQAQTAGAAAPTARAPNPAPSRTPSGPATDPRAELAAIAAPTRPDGESVNVLVVEDDLGCRDFFQDVLAARGYHVHSCSSVPAALRYIQRGHRVDLILSDINMPIFDGFELKWMLDNETRLAGLGTVPFLAVSAEDTAEKYSLALRLGAVALVPKPVKDLKRFCRLVRSTLERANEEPDNFPMPKG